MFVELNRRNSELSNNDVAAMGIAGIKPVVLSFIISWDLKKKFFFWLQWVFVAASGLSLVEASGGYSLLQCLGFSLRWLLLWSTDSRRTGFSSRGT